MPLTIKVPRYNLEYQAEVYLRLDAEKDYFLAYLPAFGKFVCNATGNTPDKALEKLKIESHEIISYFQCLDNPLPLAINTKPIEPPQMIKLLTMWIIIKFFFAPKKIY